MYATKKPFHLRRMERSIVPVSPFDGASRIRFKGSLGIFDFRFLIVGLVPTSRPNYPAGQPKIKNLKSKIPRLSAVKLPRKLSSCTRQSTTLAPGVRPKLEGAGSAGGPPAATRQ